MNVDIKIADDLVTAEVKQPAQTQDLNQQVMDDSIPF